MAHALVIASEDPLWRNNRSMKVTKGPFTYTVAKTNDGATYTVSDGLANITVPLHWVFGANNQTFVFEYEGNWYEGLVSYFSEVKGLDTTIGDAALHPATLLEALGRPIDAEEQTACFGCHSSGGQSKNGVILSALTPGVTCDHCHSGALEHQAAAMHGSRLHLPADLKASTADGMSNFCGQCHRTWATVMRTSVTGSFDVRFQPYRLANSPCYNGADRRISCVACHDPHSASLPSAATVTTKCLACHSSGAEPVAMGEHAKLCPVAKDHCASCHMQKVSLPGGHKLFTDHDIRVVHPGDPYPY
jgi:predicted CXXCH cytochrome family protein